MLRRFAARRPAAAAHGIDEIAFVPLGGIEQWISIRGRRRDNPVIPHGDPGQSQSPVAEGSRSAPQRRAAKCEQLA